MSRWLEVKKPSSGGGSVAASAVSYNDTASGYGSTQVQGVLDIIAQEIQTRANVVGAIGWTNFTTVPPLLKQGTTTFHPTFDISMFRIHAIDGSLPADGTGADGWFEYFFRYTISAAESGQITNDITFDFLNSLNVDPTIGMFDAAQQGSLSDLAFAGASGYAGQFEVPGSIAGVFTHAGAGVLTLKTVALASLGATKTLVQNDVISGHVMARVTS